MDARRGYQIPGAGIVGDSEQHGWDLNSGPVEEKQALLAAEPSQPNWRPFHSSLFLSCG